MAKLQHRDRRVTIYDDVGDRGDPAVLLLHGIGADRRMWAPQLEPFRRAGLRLLALDLFGHGGSSDLAEVGFASWHEQLIDVLDHAGVQSCAVVGVSMGGVIAQSFVVTHPHRVHKLVLADTFCELGSAAEKAAGWAQIAGFRLFGVLGRRWLARAMKANFRAPHARAARDYFVQCSMRSNLEQLLLARKTINNARFLPALKLVKTPSLVLVGEDLGQAFIRTNRKIADAIAQSRFETLPDAMDPSNLVNPHAFNLRVGPFLRRA